MVFKFSMDETLSMVILTMVISVRYQLLPIYSGEYYGTCKFENNSRGIGFSS